MKRLTREQLESRKARAVRFLRDVKDLPERADEVEDEDLESYAERRKIQLINPKRSASMANEDPRSKQDLLDEIADLEAENRDLQDTLDSIADLASLTPEIEEDEED